MLEQRNLSGEKASGFSKLFASNIADARLEIRTDPVGMLYPPIVTGSKAFECYDLKHRSFVITMNSNKKLNSELSRTLTRNVYIFGNQHLPQWIDEQH